MVRMEFFSNNSSCLILENEHLPSTHLAIEAQSWLIPLSGSSLLNRGVIPVDTVSSSGSSYKRSYSSSSAKENFKIFCQLENL